MDTPSLYEWAGGVTALETLFARFDERFAQDPELGPVFANMDPEFRSAFVSYLEWGSRLAVLNSQPGADVTAEAAMLKWGWGEAKGPYVPTK